MNEKDSGSIDGKSSMHEVEVSVFKIRQASRIVGIANQLLKSMRSPSSTKFYFLRPTYHPKASSFQISWRSVLTPELTCGNVTLMMVNDRDPEGSLSPKVPQGLCTLRLYHVLCTNVHPAHTCTYSLRSVTRRAYILF